MLIADKKKYHVQLFSGVEHGFALRGKQDDPYESKWTQKSKPSNKLLALLMWLMLLRMGEGTKSSRYRRLV